MLKLRLIFPFSKISSSILLLHPIMAAILFWYLPVAQTSVCHSSIFLSGDLFADKPDIDSSVSPSDLLLLLLLSWKLEVWIYWVLSYFKNSSTSSSLFSLLKWFSSVVIYSIGVNLTLISFSWSKESRNCLNLVRPSGVIISVAKSLTTSCRFKFLNSSSISSKSLVKFCRHFSFTLNYYPNSLKELLLMSGKFLFSFSFPSEQIWGLIGLRKGELRIFFSLVN